MAVLPAVRHHSVISGIYVEGEIDDTEAAIVRQIVTMRAAGYSLQWIATTLNDGGCVTKRGKRFYPSTIGYMLDNPKYRGSIEYYFRHDGEVHCLPKGSHEAILPDAA